MQTKDFLLALMVAIIWGANYSVIGIGLKHLDPFLLTAFRFSLCAFPLCFFIKKPNISIYIIATYGITFGVGLWGIVNLAIFNGVSPGIASLLLQFSAFFTILISSFIFKERIKFIQHIGMIIAILGLIFALCFRGEKSSLLGGILIIIASLSWSICNIIVKKYKPLEMMSFIIWSCLFSSPPLFIITYLTKGKVPFVNITNSLNPQTIFSICFQAYITTLFGYWIWNMLMKKYEATIIAPISLLIPIFGILSANIVFNEEIGYYKITSTFLILLGIYTLVFGEKTKDKILHMRISKKFKL